MQQIDNENIVQSKPVIEMLTVAHEYCLFFENCEKYSKNDILIYFQRIAALLYLKACLLPDVQVSDEELSERFVTEEQWESVFKALRDKLEKDDLYYTLDQNGDSVEASISDNLADIYQDLKDFVMLYQKGHHHAQENAIAQLQDHFAGHWGPGIIDAMKASHRLLYKVAGDKAGASGMDPWDL